MVLFVEDNAVKRLSPGEAKVVWIYIKVAQPGDVPGCPKGQKGREKKENTAGARCRKAFLNGLWVALSTLRVALETRHTIRRY
jgi:hypothetical protein